VTSQTGKAGSQNEASEERTKHGRTSCASRRLSAGLHDHERARITPGITANAIF
jgi:hypothetical protein